MILTLIKFRVRMHLSKLLISRCFFLSVTRSFLSINYRRKYSPSPLLHPPKSYPFIKVPFACIRMILVFTLNKLSTHFFRTIFEAMSRDREFHASFYSCQISPPPSYILYRKSRIYFWLLLEVKCARWPKF